MYPFKNFIDVMEYIKTSVNNPLYLSYLEEGKWVSFSSYEFIHHVEMLSSAFYAAGVHKGTTVAIVSDSSPFWLMVDYALQRIGAISVPIFANISKENLHYEVQDSGIEYVFIASQEKYDQLEEVLACMKLVVTLNIQSKLCNAVSFNEFCDRGSFLPTVLIDEDDLCTIIYTSGSTGQPKGVELTHGNFMAQIKDVRVSIPISADEIALSFLPLAHIFERMVVSYYLVNGISIYFADDVKNVGNLIREVRPTVMTVVPRLLEKIYTVMHTRVSETGGFKGIIAKAACFMAETKEVTTHTPFDGLARKLVYSKMLEGMGGRLRYVICGGAPLSPKIERFFVNIGLPLYQGYGLSETSPAICVNTPSAYRFGSCGKKLPSVSVKLLSDGELIAKGPNIMRGYHNQSVKTAEVLQEGWFHTGDLARIDEDGYIFIQGRKKELFKTSTGKYVSVVSIEHHLTHSKLIDYAVVVADNRPYVTALIFLDPLMSIEPYAQYVKDPKTHKRIERLVKSVNVHLNAWEKIQKYTLIETLPTIENHLLTPSMKVARHKVYEAFEEEIEAMYIDTPEGASL